MVHDLISHDTHFKLVEHYHNLIYAFKTSLRSLSDLQRTSVKLGASEESCSRSYWKLNLQWYLSAWKREEIPNGLIALKTILVGSM